MALPKGFRNNIRLTSPNIGVPRRQELLDNIADDGTFLPRGVLYQDMDETFIEFINKELNIEIDGNQVPVIFLTLQRYSEFTKTWQFTDEYKNIKIPFITIVRKPDVQVGTNYNGLYNVPGRPTFTYYKVPTNDGARVGVDVYKIPQPTSVDITYEVRLFTNKMSDLNLLNEKVQKKFQSRQAYIWPKGHPMPVMLESIGDESNIDDFENRRFYVQPFEMLLAGYILDENDFEIIPTINRAMVMSEIELADGITTPITDPKKGGGCIVATQGSVIVRNTNNTVLSVVSCGENYVVGNSLIFNSGNTYSQLVPATTNFELPNVINIDSDGSAVLTPAMVGFTATTCQDVTIINSGATYSANTPAGSIFQLPNETINIIDSSGGTINTIQYPPLSSLNLQISGFCSPVIITNSGNTFYHSTQSGSNYELPNITHIDSNGNPVTLPAQTPFTATTCNPPSITITLYSDAGLTTPITTANYGQTIYINAVASGLTPTQYSFSLTNGSKSQTFNQAGATLTYVVEQFGSVAVAASARDGSTGVSVSATSTLTVIVVKNACAFDGVNDVALGGLIIDGRLVDHSFSFWAKIDNTGATQAFFSINTDGRPAFAITYVGANTTIRIGSWASEWGNYQGVITPDNNYHFYTVSYNYATKLMSVYYDNALLFTVASWDYGQNFDLLCFGRQTDFPFVGGDYGNITMKDFRIHDAVLDLATVQAMYADDTVMSGSEVQWFPFYEPIGTTTGKITDIIADRKMNLNNMTSPFGIVAP